MQVMQHQEGTQHWTKGSMDLAAATKRQKNVAQCLFVASTEQQSAKSPNTLQTPLRSKWDVLPGSTPNPLHQSCRAKSTVFTMPFEKDVAMNAFVQNR